MVSDNSNFVFSYNFLYYSLYQCYRRWSFFRDAPQFYAALASAFLVCLLVDAVAIVFAAHGYNMWEAPIFEHLPRQLSSSWPFFLTLAANSIYFLRHGRWKTIVEGYDALPLRIKAWNHAASGMIVVFSFVCIFSALIVYSPR